MSFTLCTSGAIVAKAGANVNSAAALSGTLLQQYCDEAEGIVCAATLFDWVANYATVGANYKGALTTAVSALGGNKLIAYDMSGYTGRGEAEDMINLNYTEAANAINVLKDAETKSKMGVQ